MVENSDSMWVRLFDGLNSKYDAQVPKTARKLKKERIMNLIKIALVSMVLAFSSGFLGSDVMAKEPTQATESRVAQKVNLNSADAKAIAKAMKGIGLKKAETIVAYRTANGPFKRVEDLLKIKGIGAATLTKNVDLITL